MPAGVAERRAPEDEWEDEESADEWLDADSTTSAHSSGHGHARESRRRKAHRRSESRRASGVDEPGLVAPRRRSQVAPADAPADAPRSSAAIQSLEAEREDMATPVASARPSAWPAPHDAKPAPVVAKERLGNALYAVLVVLGITPPPNFDEAHMHPPPRPERPERQHTAVVASLWDHLCDEVLVNSSDGMHEMKWERVANFMAIPVWIEKTVCFGFLICLNSLLYTFTILPMRFVMAWWTWAYNTSRWLVSGEKHYLTVSHKCDMLKGLLVVQTCYILSHVADASKMYHSVRGQDVLKLSVIFSVLEIADRLCCSFGQDILDALFSRSTLARRANGTQPYRRMIGYYALALAYMLFHTLVLLYQLVTLNVAINSYDNALLTLLLSNQFVEIKTTVFKRFEKENLFQLTCADIVERFQLTMVLTAIGARNLIEVAGAQTMSGTSTLGPLPTSFDVYPYVNVLARTLNPVLTVLLSEMLVDWLKHAFITKLNHIRPAIYGRYIDVLCRDLLATRAAKMDGDHKRQSSFVDQSPIVTRRLGLAVLPLTCILIRLGSQIAEMITQSRAASECAFHPAPPDSWAQEALEAVHGRPSAFLQSIERSVAHSAWILVALTVWVLVVVVKILLGLNLVHFATARYATRAEREAEEARNARGRPPIGEMPHETAHAQIQPPVDRPEDNATSHRL
ncbi:hypothetical protein MOBT1_002902 [Malassezia obtusa]|uniref:Eukaryotic membrane protein family-domain-containing protein n=1 Tax=Malassezia obtusa TaxID=76774 RepID=A0AAF0E627_9BASI|nr:hypothetical protein MOBT1_002902 [Malassezia obtusa]